MKKIYNVVAIIIARLSSSRLPKKHLRQLYGFPLIYHVIKRLKYSQRIDQIIIATGPKRENQELADYALLHGVESFFDEDINDVTGRVAKAGVYFAADYIVTISGDCPLVDPSFVDEGLELLIKNNQDYIYVDHAKNDCLHEGVGFFKLNAWLTIDKLSTTWFHKEHPGSVLKEHQGIFKGLEMIPKIDYQRHDFRMSIDTMADLNFMNEVYRELGDKDDIVDLHKVVKLIDQNPWLKQLNGHVHQKAVTEKSNTFLFITHASKEIGMGHVSRSIALAIEMQETFGAKTLFYVNNVDIVSDILDKQGLHYHLADEFGSSIELEGLINQYKFSGLIIDLKKDVLHNSFDFVTKLSTPSILIDNLSEGKFEELLSIIPAIRIDKSKKTKSIFQGRQFLILRREILYWREKRDLALPKGILVMSGGANLPSKKLLQVLSHLNQILTITFIIGPFASRSKLEKNLNKLAIVNYRVEQNPEQIFKEIKKSKLVILTFGVSTYECLALGVPVYVFDVLNPDDLKIVRHLARKKLLVNEFDDNNALMPEDIINNFLINYPKFKKRSLNALKYIDAHGAARVVKIINQYTSE